MPSGVGFEASGKAWILEYNSLPDGGIAPAGTGTRFFSRSPEDDMKASAIREDIFNEAVTQIEAAYGQLGHRLGWRFLATPRATLNCHGQTAFITLNPGGRSLNPTHAVASSEVGSAYIYESWKNGLPPGQSPLQQQV